MSNDLNMKVNVLPVLTYNFLHVNDSTLQISDFNITDKNAPLAKELPAGVTVEKAVPFAEAGEIFRKNNDRILAAIDGHVEPNGDTSKRDDSQALRTGMGADVDSLMISMGATVDIYTVDEGVKADKPIVINYDMKDGDASLSGQIIHAKKDSEVTVIIAYTSESTEKDYRALWAELRKIR